MVDLLDLASDLCTTHCVRSFYGTACDEGEQGAVLILFLTFQCLPSSKEKRLRVQESLPAPHVLVLKA